MSDYEKKLPSGRILAKRGYAYYLYDDFEALHFDDAKVATNIERKRRGDEVFNRAEWGGWIVRSRKLAQIKAYDKHLSEVEIA